MARAKSLNTPNILPMFRIFLVPLLVVVILTRLDNKEIIGAGIFLLAAFTDWLDGFLARRHAQVTNLGTLLDPIADKLLVSAAFIALVEVGLAPAWMVIIIIGREFALMGLRGVALLHGITIPASWWGKVKMVSQIVAITMLLLGKQFVEKVLFADAGRAALWGAMIITVVSGVEYFRKFAKAYPQTFQE